MPSCWAIRWKRKQMNDGTIEKAVNAAQCGKGLTNRQRQGPLTYSLRKLVVHTAACYDFEVTRVDVTAVLLQDMTLDELDKLYSKYGIISK
eukprot:10658162-Heterocapsa_arctica.AAC.1